MCIRPNAKCVFAIRTEFEKRLRAPFRKRSPTVELIGRKNFGRHLRLKPRPEFFLRLRNGCRPKFLSGEARRANCRNWKRNLHCVDNVPLKSRRVRSRQGQKRPDGTERVRPLNNNSKSSACSTNFTC